MIFVQYGFSQKLVGFANVFALVSKGQRLGIQLCGRGESLLLVELLFSSSSVPLSSFSSHHLSGTL